jgi:hypothetical protein
MPNKSTPHDRHPGLSEANICRAEGWGVGTRLVGTEGTMRTVIEITALGEKTLLAKSAERRGNTGPYRFGPEHIWTLRYRDWRVTDFWPSNE